MSKHAQIDFPLCYKLGILSEIEMLKFSGRATLDVVKYEDLENVLNSEQQIAFDEWFGCSTVPGTGLLYAWDVEDFLSGKENRD